MAYSYIGSEGSAKACGRSISVSPRHAIEVCNAIRKKNLARAKAILNAAISLKQPIPFTQFTQVGHRRGRFCTGRFPKNACKGILSLIESAEANAVFKGLNANDLVIKHISANKAPSQWHHGRISRRKMKRVHVEVVLESKKPASVQNPSKK